MSRFRPRLTPQSHARLLLVLPPIRAAATGEQSIHPFLTDENGLVMAVVNLQMQGGKQVQFELDSGADISCLPTTQAVALGLNPASGQPLQMAGVDDKPFTVYMQMLQSQMPGIPAPFQFPFCIGDAIDCLLFGRQGVWNQFTSILLDQKAKQTVFTV